MIFDNEMIEKLRGAERVVVVTGSGISAESGIPTFRGKDGLWKKYRAEELATPHAFFSDPQLVWEWYDWRRGIIGQAEPNPGHTTIAGMERHYDDFLLITQNVDGLHGKAGSRKIVEIHGNIWKARCTNEMTERFLEENPLSQLPPRCECGALLRPAVVWFGESLPVNGILKAEKAIKSCDVLMAVGTSGYVYPVASFPMAAQVAGATVIEINIEETPISQIADYTLLGKAGDILPLLWKKIECGVK